MDADALPFGVNVRFEDEQEAEGMGVVREWLSQIAADLFSPERGLFVRGAADRRAVHPSAAAALQDDHLGYMRFAGRIVGEWRQRVRAKVCVYTSVCVGVGAGHVHSSYGCVHVLKVAVTMSVARSFGNVSTAVRVARSTPALVLVPHPCAAQAWPCAPTCPWVWCSAPASSTS